MRNPFKREKSRVKVDLDEGRLAGEKKLSLPKRLGKQVFKYKLSFNTASKADPEESADELPEAEAAESTDTAEPAAPPPKPKKASKPKPVKKPKPKKAAKPKPKPKPKKKPAKKKADPGEEKNKKPLIIGIVAGVIAIGGGATAAVLLMGGNSLAAPSPQEILAQGQEQLVAQQFTEAEATFAGLIEDRETLDATIVADAYLGLTDTKLAVNAIAQDAFLASTISTLQEGLDFTEDSRLQDKIDELTPVPEGEKPSPTDLPVTFTDPAFERMIRTALNKPSPEDIRQSELASIKSLKIIGDTHAVVNETLNSINRKDGYTIDGITYTERGTIRSLADIVHFTGLTRLVICYNDLADISGVEVLESLETLGLYFNQIQSIEPVSGLTSLRCLYIYNNAITDIGPVSGLTNLEELWAQNNQIADLSPVSGLEKLRELFVSDNAITDITAIGLLPELTFFYAANNQISDISAVAGLSTLTDVSFLGNPVTDLSPASGIRNVNKPIFGDIARQ